MEINSGPIYLNGRWLHLDKNFILFLSLVVIIHLKVQIFFFKINWTKRTLYAGCLPSSWLNGLVIIFALERKALS